MCGFFLNDLSVYVNPYGIKKTMPEILTGPILCFSIQIMDIHTKFRQHRESLGISRYRLWRDTGIHHDTIRRFESGHLGVSLSTISRLCAALGVEVVCSLKPGPVDNVKSTPNKGTTAK